MGTHPISRVPAGTPGGGRFAVDPAAESVANMGDTDADLVTDSSHARTAEMARRARLLHTGDGVFGELPIQERREAVAFVDDVDLAWRSRRSNDPRQVADDYARDAGQGAVTDHDRVMAAVMMAEAEHSHAGRARRRATAAMVAEHGQQFAWARDSQSMNDRHYGPERATAVQGCDSVMLSHVREDLDDGELVTGASHTVEWPLHPTGTRDRYTSTDPVDAAHTHTWDTSGGTPRLVSSTDPDLAGVADDPDAVADAFEKKVWTIAAGRGHLTPHDDKADFEDAGHWGLQMYARPGATPTSVRIQSDWTGFEPYTTQEQP